MVDTASPPHRSTLPGLLSQVLPLALAAAAVTLVACAGLDESEAAGGEAIGRATSSGLIEPARGGASTGGAASLEHAGRGGSLGGASGVIPAAGGAGSAPAVGDCCTEALCGGCQDAAIESCVCASDPHCCQTAWDSLCVELAASACGAGCTDDDDDDDDQGSGGGGGCANCSG